MEVPPSSSATTNWAKFLLQNWLATTATLLCSLIVFEQLLYRWRGRGMKGPRYVVPFIGNIIQMVFHPYDFWHTQFAMGRLSWNAIVGKFMVIVSDAGFARKIFEQTSARMPLVLHPNAYKILGTNNIAFMNGSAHKELRMKLLPLFTQKALGIYLDIQEKTIHEHLSKWFELSSKLKNDEEITMKNLVWDLNVNTSLSVFVGPYLTDITRGKLRNSYKKMTDGFLSFPIYFPGTGLWKGVKARHYIVSTLTQYAALSKQRMRQGEEPLCLLDFWMQGTIIEIDEAKSLNKKNLPLHSSDYEVACTVLDFLFASQDASTASLTWCIHYMAKYPLVLQKIREEQIKIRPNNEKFTTDIINSLVYTNQVMREILRDRPPATMVPHIALDPCTVGDKTESVYVPSGAMIVPSIWSACHSGFSDPHTFDPDRFSKEREEEKKFEKHFLTFGCGPHVCLGQRYAMNHIMCFLSITSMMADFVRKNTKNMNEITYMPTIYPKDGCVVTSITPRQQQIQQQQQIQLQPQQVVV